MYVKVDKFNVTYYEIIFFGTSGMGAMEMVGTPFNNTCYIRMNEQMSSRKRESERGEMGTGAAYFKWLNVLFIML